MFEDEAVLKHTILVVDDDLRVLEMVLQSLRNEQYHILTADSAESGLAILNDNNDIDLVVSDYSMPGMSGIDFLMHIKRDCPGVLTILQSGYSDYQLAMEAINNVGVYKLIEKPWDAIWFAETIKKALTSLAIVRKRDEVANRAKVYEAELNAMERNYPGITKVEKDSEGYVILPEIDI